MQRILIGQAPAASSGEEGLPLEGRCGDRLARLAGLEGYAELTELFAVGNLLGRFPGRAGKGDIWPRAEANAAAARVHEMLGEEEWDRVVLLGCNVAAAMGLAAAPFLRWLEPTAGVDVRIAVVGLREPLPARPMSREQHYSRGEWLVPDRFQNLVWPDARFAVLPHPSGVCRWWNEPENEAAAARFLRRIVEA